MTTSSSPDVLVPREPTDVMIEAARAEIARAQQQGWHGLSPTDIYRTMIAALGSSAKTPIPAPADGQVASQRAWPTDDPRCEIDVTYEIWCGDNLEASSTDIVDARRYEAQYQPCSLLKATTYRHPVGLHVSPTDQSSDVSGMVAALEFAQAWLLRWASHVGSCATGHQCTCGLTRVRLDVSEALAQAKRGGS